MVVIIAAQRLHALFGLFFFTPVYGHYREDLYRVLWVKSAFRGSDGLVSFPGNHAQLPAMGIARVRSSHARVPGHQTALARSHTHFASLVDHTIINTKVLPVNGLGVVFPITPRDSLHRLTSEFRLHRVCAHPCILGPMRVRLDPLRSERIGAFDTRRISPLCSVDALFS